MAPPKHDPDVWLFDLDNTLYPARCNLFAQIDVRIGRYISDWLKVTPEEARVVQKQYWKDHGTSMRGMMSLHGVDPKHYLDYVHDIDYSPVPPSPEVKEVWGSERLDELLRISDVVASGLPLTKDTHHLFNARTFGLMKPTALFVNVTRGEIFDPDALMAAIRATFSSRLVRRAPALWLAKASFLTVPNNQAALFSGFTRAWIRATKACWTMSSASGQRPRAMATRAGAS